MQDYDVNQGRSRRGGLHPPRRKTTAIIGVTVALSAFVSFATAAAPAAFAQTATSAGQQSQTGSGAAMRAQTQQGMPTSVLLFPVVIGGAEGGGAAAAAGGNAAGGGAAGSGTAGAANRDELNPRDQMLQEVVTDALRRQLSQSGIGVVVYNRRLPSVQRAVSEGLKPDEADQGPGDDPRKAQRFAEMLGATEYLMVNLEDYKYDAATRTATFNLSVMRNNIGDTAPLATAAQRGQGIAPTDVAGPRQEGSAAARAAQVAAEQVVEDLFPRLASAAEPASGPTGPTVRRNSAQRFVLPAFGIVLGLLILSNK